ncbi:hypothetical protein O6H91_13G014600 [Diphasiastrum complanatum]|uniref:Uncharacterized protein n=1 Tax=Diphasiastrum complanatum TaxID=34168 RepID=A0ACC2BSD9_DIPCM|nr:hypothetical protein O6H91_Y525100 [Diphasiastrum complanatum]KAJ7532694.1 hypothetical protein O6H91_13G014600 [Diphasiastrum complanatum]
MALNWASIGDVASLVQLTGLDSLKLISLIVKAANNARMHKRNCRRFAQHLKLIGNLLEQLQLSELRAHAETREPLEQLDEELRKAFVLVNSCQDRSYLYLLAMGWTIVTQFKHRQLEIDRLLHLIPLITLVENNRGAERLRAIERDKHEYTLDEEELKLQNTIFKPERTKSESRELERSLSLSYPGVPLDEALRKENEKLRKELSQMQAVMETDQCDVIQHLIDITETAGATGQQKSDGQESETEYNYSEAKQDEYQTEDTNNHTKDTRYSTQDAILDTKQSLAPKNDPYPGQQEDAESDNSWRTNHKVSRRAQKWHYGLFECLMEPKLCILTFFYPCGTFTSVATNVTDGQISPEEACTDFMTYSLILGCFCYTCCYRRKLRNRFHIRGCCCCDFLAHCLCFSCALVQETRELKLRKGLGYDRNKQTAPIKQNMIRD